VTPPEVWLRGALPGIAPVLQPAAHSLAQVREELERLLPPLTAEMAWRARPGAACVAFHARHLAASTDRLFTYARGESLTELQRARLARESERPEPAPDGIALWREVAAALDDAQAQLSAWSTQPLEALLAPRSVGRSALPSTVLGLLFHAAEHAQRHAGQVATTLRLTAPADGSGGAA
jgi:uncharacterized damage-inducible protein DinB